LESENSSSSEPKAFERNPTTNPRCNSHPQPRFNPHSNPNINIHLVFANPENSTKARVYFVEPHTNCFSVAKPRESAQCSHLTPSTI